MKKLLLLVLLLFTIDLTASAQKSIIKGSVIDTTTKSMLANATISILRDKDSTLVKFSRADQHGNFILHDIPNGEFLIMVTYPKYADYIDFFKLDGRESGKEFGTIKLTTKATLLANVIIRGTAAIRIKGDTTEFDAAAYKIQPNAKVEDLLKQLPGIQVDKDGKITAQGKTVNKVLVDGEEFFGDDPTLVTKNIRGDMVEKVQLFDKKSDQATFTGIDDDKQDKTINIKLKEDKKNGYFGKAEASGGTDDFYQGQAMFNAFRGKRKLSAFGTIANTGKIGLGWREQDRYASSNNIELMDGGGIMITNGNDEMESFDGRYNGQGIPLARNGGVHYDGKWNSDKESINSNYKIGSLDLTGNRDGISQNNLPDGIINTTSDESFDNYMFRQKLDAIYQLKIDSTSNLKISVDGTLKNSETRSGYFTTSLRDDSTLLNRNTRTLSNDGKDKLFNASVYWTKKLKKKGRTFSLNISESASTHDSEGFLKSSTTFYAAGLATDSVVDQYKSNDHKSSKFALSLAYTEPLSKSLSLVVNYGLGISNNNADSKSFNKDGTGRYTELDSLYSNTYKLNQLSNQAGAFLNMVTKKATIKIGTNVSAVKFEQEHLQRNNTFERNFRNWNPQASFNYKISRQEGFRLSYYGQTQQPSINDINPVRINTDPLNITLGNPNLKPSFQSDLSLNYNSYKVLTGQSIWLGGNYSITNNPIVSNSQTDSAGRSVFQSINIKEKNNASYYVYINFDRKIKSIDANAGINFDMNGSTNYSYMNTALNQTNSQSYGLSMNLSKYKEKKYESSIRMGPTYKRNQSSLQKDINDNGWGFNGNAAAGVYFPLKMELASDANYEYRAKTQSFNSDFKRLLWNVRLSKSFLKSDNLKLILSVNDLLNQNKGFDRSASGNMITQNSYTTIRRYYMASLVWDFSKMGGATTE